MKAILLIFIGGGAGSVFRFLISKTLNIAFFRLPVGTLTVNVVGSFLIGMFISWLAGRGYLMSSVVNPLIVIGFLGGFTTFSSLAFEQYNFVRGGSIGLFFLYLSLTIILGLLAVYFGITIYNRFFDKS